MISEDRLHDYSMARVTTAIVPRVADTHYVAPCIAVQTSLYSEPKPDFVLASRVALDDRTTPTRVELAVEVSSRSLLRDREGKTSLYAAADIPEYWIVNVRDRKLEVARDPVRLKGRGFRHGYKSVIVYGEEDTVSPLCRPDVSIMVKELF